MRSSMRILAVVAACLMAASLAVGCAKKAQVTTVPATTSVAESATPPPVIETPPAEKATAVSDGPITTPEAGSDERTALMDAARKRIGTTSQFVVYQLFVQGDAAVADLETVSGGKRQFVAFKGGDKWEAEWVAAFGSAGASAAKAKKEVPGLSDELLGKLDWTYKKPASSAAMIASLSAAAKKWTKSLMDGVGEPYSVTLVKVAKDSKGVWWGRAVVQPASSASSSYESIEFWAKYSGGAWKGKAQDPDPPSPTTYFPSSVIGALGL